MAEDHQPISSSRVAASDVSRHTFTTLRRGYDPQEVRAYLEAVARELTAWEQREQELRRELAEAEERARHPVIDESTLSAALGEQSAQVLRNAHDEAARVTLQAEEAAAALSREAQTQAAELRVQTESGAAARIAEAELAAGNLNQQAQREVTEIIEASKVEGENIVNRAREQGQALIEQAQETRRQVLADMAQRRRAMTHQIEQFRAARDELAAAVLGLRTTVDEMIADLSKADDRARAAAAEVARRQPAEEGDADAADGGASADGLPDQSPASPGAGGIYDAMAEEAAAGVGGEEDAVEGLFARLRASHSEPSAGATAAGPAPEPVPGGEGEAPAATGADGPPADAPAEAADGGSPEAPDLLEARRSELLDPVVAQLSRHVKRALQDDQNRLLDRLRNGSGSWSDAALVPEDEQRALYVKAASADLRDAMAAGVTFGREQPGGARGKAPTVDHQAVARVADGLAATVVALLRRRLVDPESTDGAEGGAERVGGAYREWRGQRVERLVGDYGLEAFAAGVMAAVATGAGLRWVVGAAEGPCADCEDNALAGTVAVGEPFPTGHLLPPAHPGCRCLVVPTPT